MTVNPYQWAPASGKLLADAFFKEVDALGAIASQPLFRALVRHFDDYAAGLERLGQDRERSERLRLLREGGLIDTSQPTPELVALFCEAQLAGCCELLDGMTLAETRLNRSGMRQVAEQATAALAEVPAFPEHLDPRDYSDTQRQLLNAVNRVQNLDTIRVMTVLRLLGALGPTADNARQLSLAAGNGYRDLYGVHALPRIVTLDTSTSRAYQFATVERQPDNIVLIDNDPMQREHYQQLNDSPDSTVLALNEDAHQALDGLATQLEARGFGPRNLVVGLRIDHRMIPDAAALLAQFHDVIDTSADLVLTIGAGNKLEEFEGRMACLDSLTKVLQELELEPLRILLHGGSTAAEQRASLNFGHLEYGTYQVLHCRLQKEKLAGLTG